MDQNVRADAEETQKITLAESLEMILVESLEMIPAENPEMIPVEILEMIPAEILETIPVENPETILAGREVLMHLCQAIPVAAKKKTYKRIVPSKGALQRLVQCKAPS